jgi:hypothetical protein
MELGPHVAHRRFGNPNETAKGRVAFETRNPHLDWVGEWAARSRVCTLSGEQLVETLEITDKNGEFISFQTSYQFPQETLTTSSTLRFPSREQVEALIAHSGLTVRDLFGDWKAGTFEPARSREMIFVAQITELHPIAPTAPQTR